MKHRTRENKRFWESKIETLFNTHAESKLTEHRFQAVRACLTGTYPWIAGIDKEKFIEMLQNADYLARIMRRKTEKLEVTTKKILSQEYILENL